MDSDRTSSPARLSEPPLAPSERRFFVEPDLPLAVGDKLELSEEAAKHARVCRLAVGNPVEVFDGQGRAAPALITGLWSRLLTIELTAPARRLARGPALSMILCVPRAGKLDDIVRQTCELGITAIHLAISDFSVGTAARVDSKLSRLDRVAREALRQSEGAYLPQLHPPTPLREVVERVGSEGQRVMLAARGGAPLHLEAYGSPAWMVVGPEGGLSPREEAMLHDRSFVAATLGPSVLRVETAAVVGAALALYQLRGDAG